MKHKPQKMFGAINDRWGKVPWVASWTIKRTARQVRAEVANAYGDGSGDIDAGWRAARAEGMRVVKVEVRICT